MKKASLKASSAVALGLAALSFAPAAFAQGAGPFADVPTDHWAYAAVDKLQKQGIVIGYPDGTYGGKRSMTRYEFAIAIARLLDKVGTAPPVDLSGYARKSDLDAYATKTDLAGLAKQSDLDQLRRLVNEFQTELTTLGVDLDATKRRLDALEGRVRAIEAEQRRVKIGGEVNVMGRGNHRGSDNKQVLDYDGFQITKGRGSRGSILSDSRVLHDVDVNIKARLSDTATADVILNFGNYLSFLNGITSYSGQRSTRVVQGGFPSVANQDQTQTVYRAAVSAPVRIGGLGGIDLTVGRLPLQLTPYTLKQIDVDSYFYNEKTDLGDIPVDGVKASGKIGPVAVTGFGAKLDPIKFVSNVSGAFTGDTAAYGLYAGASRGSYRNFNNNNNNSNDDGFAGNTRVVSDSAGAATRSGNRPVQSGVSPTTNGAMSVEQLAGVRATFGAGSFGTIGGTYVAFAGTPSTTILGINPFTVPGGYNGRENFDRVFLYAGDVNTNIKGIGVLFSYAKTDTGGPRQNGNGLSSKTNSKTTGDNNAFDIAGTYTKNAISLTGGYKKIDTFFAAPGYWDKIGAYTNPTDIEGAYVKGKYTFSPTLALQAEGKFYSGTGDNRDEGGLRDDDRITNLKAGLKYGLTSASSVDAGIERTEYKIGATGAKPLEYFYNIGYGYAFNPATSFKVLYQIVDYRDKGTNFDTQNGKGGVGTAQFSVKF